MTACVRAVNRAKADLGIVVDTDVDRSAVVGSNGAPISSNRYIALMASIALRHVCILRSFTCMLRMQGCDENGT